MHILEWYIPLQRLESKMSKCITFLAATSRSKNSDDSHVGPKTIKRDNCEIVILMKIVKIVISVTIVTLQKVGTIMTIVTVMKVVVLLK